MTDYRSKYLKYKNKYLNIKSVNISGGGNEIVIYQNGSKEMHNIQTCHVRIIEFVTKKVSDIAVKLDDNQLNILIDLVINGIGYVVDHPEFTIKNELNTHWGDIKGSKIEEFSQKRIAITLDPSYSQFMIFTKNGFARLQTYHDLEKTSIGEDDVQNVRIFFNTVEDSDEALVGGINSYGDLLKPEKIAKTKEYQIQNVLTLMCKYYLTHGMRFIALLGKSRFQVAKLLPKECNKPNITTGFDQNRTPAYWNNIFAKNAGVLTNEVVSNLIFRDCNLGFITNADKIRIYDKHIHFLLYKNFFPKKGYTYDNIFYDNILS